MTVFNAGNFSAVGSRGDGERREAKVHSDPAAAVVVRSGGVPKCRMKISGLHIESNPPASGPVADGREENLGASFGQHAT